MKTRIILIAVISFFSFGSVMGQKVQSFTISRTIQSPASKVWKVVGEEFGDIAKTHPNLSSSHYLDGNKLGGEGCTRVCNLDDKGKKYTKEKQVDYNPTEYSFKAKIYAKEGIPMDPAYSYMAYKVVPVDANSCKLILTMNYRTKPAFMGALAKGKFKKTINDYAIGVQHYVQTGEEVTRANFSKIKAKY